MNGCAPLRMPVIVRNAPIEMYKYAYISPTKELTSSTGGTYGCLLYTSVSRSNSLIFNFANKKTSMARSTFKVPVSYTHLDMNLMDELLKIPADATAATVQGIERLLIDENKAGALLESDPNDNTIHECLLSNGRFRCV